jgi:hypothetical protein
MTVVPPDHVGRSARLATHVDHLTGPDRISNMTAWRPKPITHRSIHDNSLVFPCRRSCSGCAATATLCSAARATSTTQVV